MNHNVYIRIAFTKFEYNFSNNNSDCPVSSYILVYGIRACFRHTRTGSMTDAGEGFTFLSPLKIIKSIILNVQWINFQKKILIVICLFFQTPPYPTEIFSCDIPCTMNVLQYFDKIIVFTLFLNSFFIRLENLLSIEKNNLFKVPTRFNF